MRACVRAPPDLNSIPRCLTDKIFSETTTTTTTCIGATNNKLERLTAWRAGVTTAEHALLLPSFLPSLLVPESQLASSWTLDGTGGNRRYTLCRARAPSAVIESRNLFQRALARRATLQEQRSRYDDKMVTPRRKEEESGAPLGLLLTHQIDEKDSDGGGANPPARARPRPSISPPRNRLHHHRHQLRCRDHQGRHAKITALKDGAARGRQP